jgi:hypothetical protein
MFLLLQSLALNGKCAAQLFAAKSGKMVEGTQNLMGGFSGLFKGFGGK